jgi:hypothetical protein
MATWLVTYSIGEELEEREIVADYIDDEGLFVKFIEENDSGTGAGGTVFMVLAELLVSVDRVPDPGRKLKPKHILEEHEIKDR